MSIRYKNFLTFLGLLLLTMPMAAWSQEDDPFALEGVEEEVDEQPVIEDEVTVGVYYLDEDAFRFGKYTGVTDKGAELLADFKVETRPQWDSGDTRSWSLEGWRLGLDSRRLEYKIRDQGLQSFSADYREIPNNRFNDGATPYSVDSFGVYTLPSDWAVAPGSSNTAGFLNLSESLSTLQVDTKRRWVDLSYDRAFNRKWKLRVAYTHISKEGERTLASIFGYTGGNPRGVILAAPVDYKTDNIELMFEYASKRVQAGFGVYTSFFHNDEDSLVWQNAFGRQSQWAESVMYPGSQGRIALEPANSYVQLKGYAGINISPSSRLTADLSLGRMEQDDTLLPYTVNPNLNVYAPVPLVSLNAKVDTTMLNLRYTNQLSRRLNLALNYHYDDRDNKTPRAVYPYIGGDSQDQRPYEDGRINLPYSYSRKDADALLTVRLPSRTRLKAGLEYADISREYSEVTNSDEWAWLVGVRFNAFETTGFSLDYRNSRRDIDAYVGNALLIESHIPGTIEEDEWENHPLLRKYYLTDRDREEIRGRLDFYPVEQLNFGISGSYFEDDYGEGYFGLNNAEAMTLSFDFGWYPLPNLALVAYYTKEEYDSDQSSRSFRNEAGAMDPANNWFVSTSDDVETWNVSLNWSDIGADKGWRGFNLGLDYTVSDVRSLIDVTAATATTEPLPPLKTDMSSVSAWASLDVGLHSSLRLSLENNRLSSADFSLDNVMPATLSNVLLTAETAANYDVLFVQGSWTYRF